MELAVRDGSSTKIAAAAQGMAGAQRRLTETQGSALEDRRAQLHAINARYDGLITRHRDVLHSYSGHPYYVEPSYALTHSLPGIASETDRFRVSISMLLYAVEKSDEWFEKDHTLPPRTRPVDADGVPVIF
jgi:hypothetical protein